ncbi:MAG: hypothetical protein HY909_20205 [Deltaproteobacteria bacterium]|nr:hypothetical protein [Deltaproteobacteria bacterium]
MARKNILPWSMLALVGALAAGCPAREPELGEGLEFLSPVAVGNGLTWVERHRALAWRQDLSTPEGAVRRLRLGPDPVLSVARQGADETLVLSRGQRGAPGRAPSPGVLTALPSAASAPPRVYTLGSPFNGLAQTADGRYALAHFRPEATQGRLLFNPNEVALVDLSQAPGMSNPVLRTVRSFGGVPNRVVFSPAMAVNGRSRTLAVVLSDAYLTLLDMDQPSRAEITVRLTLPEDPRAIRPSQVLFDTNDATLYVRADASNDIYVLRLLPVTPEGPSANDFRPTVNQLAAGRQPTDMALVGAADNRRLLVVSPGSRDARVLDARSNTVTEVPLEAPAERLLLFEGAAPRDPRSAPRALLFATTLGTTAVSFVDLTDLEERRGRNVETIQLQRAVRGAVSLPERQAVLLEHPTDATGGRLSLLDLVRRTASPIIADTALEGATFDEDRQTLWVAPRGQSRVGFIELRNFHPGEVRLDGPVADVITLPGSPGAGPRVLALHPSAAGWVTLLDGRSPARETARSFRGFLLADLLEEP